MAMLLTESQMRQRVEFEELGINFIKENRELYESLEAKILVENLKLEKFLIDDMFPEQVLQESEMLNEGLLADIGIGLGSLIPGIGSAVAAGGTIYYLKRAYDAKNKGETLTFYLELLSSFLTAGQIVGPIGAIVGQVGKIISAPFKLLFRGLKGFGSFVLKLFGKGAVEGAEAGLKAVAPEAGKLVGTGAKEAGKGASKIAGYMDDFIKFFDVGGTGATILKKVGIDTAEFITACRNLQGMLKGFGSFMGKVAGKEGDDLTNAVIQNVDEAANPARIAGVIDDQTDDALKLLQKQAAEAGEDVAQAQSRKALAKTAKTRAKDAQKAVTAALDDVGAAATNQNITNAFRRIGSNLDIGKFSKSLKGTKLKTSPGNISNLETMLKRSNDFTAETARGVTQLLSSGKPTIQAVTKGSSRGSVGFRVLGKNGKSVSLTPAQMSALLGGPEQLLKLVAKPANKQMLKSVAQSAKALKLEKAALKAAKKANKKITKELAAAIKDNAAKQAANLADDAVEETLENVAKNPTVLSKFLDGFTKALVGDKNAQQNLVVLTYAAAGGVAKDELSELETEAELDPETQAWMDSLNFAEEENTSIDLGSEEDLQESRYLADLIWESKLRNNMIKQQKLINLIS